jgi:hypothetical protein
MHFVIFSDVDGFCAVVTTAVTTTVLALWGMCTACAQTRLSNEKRLHPALAHAASVAMGAFAPASQAVH